MRSVLHCHSEDVRTSTEDDSEAEKVRAEATTPASSPKTSPSKPSPQVSTAKNEPIFQSRVESLSESSNTLQLHYEAEEQELQEDDPPLLTTTKPQQQTESTTEQSMATTRSKTIILSTYFATSPVDENTEAARINRNRSNAHKFREHPFNLVHTQGVEKSSSLPSSLPTTSSINSSLTQITMNKHNSVDASSGQQDNQKPGVNDTDFIVKSEIIYMFERVKENSKKLSITDVTNMDEQLGTSKKQPNNSNMSMLERLRSNQYSFCVSSKSSEQFVGQHLLTNIKDTKQFRIALKKDYLDTLDLTKIRAIYSQFESTFIITGMLLKG